MVIADSINFRDSHDRRLRFDDVINLALPHLVVLRMLKFHGNPE
jgi:hypothetical protein